MEDDYLRMHFDYRKVFVLKSCSLMAKPYKNLCTCTLGTQPRHLELQVIYWLPEPDHLKHINDINANFADCC